MRRALFLAYVLGIGFVLLSPSVAVPSESVGWGAGVAERLGAPAWILEPARWEFLCNALVFVPVPVLGVAAWPATGPLSWARACLAGSVGVEVVQALLLPERSATAIDVVANTTGAIAGSLLVAGLSRRRTAAGTRPTSPARRARLPGPRR